MELKATDHSYYCNDGNYYVGNLNGENYGRCDYDTWEEFKEAWLDEDLTIDHDYNHCFRFDILNHYDPETDKELEDKFTLKLYMMLQRKGNFRPVIIRNIYSEDRYEIETYLNSCWEYMKYQWKEFN